MVRRIESRAGPRATRRSVRGGAGTATSTALVASDGDGDRIAAMTGDGEYVSPHHIFALLLIHLVEDHGLAAAEVVKTGLHHHHDQPACGALRLAALLRDAHRLQIHRPTDDGPRHSHRRGGERRHRHSRATSPSATPRRPRLLLAEMMAQHRTDLRGLLDLLRDRVGGALLSPRGRPPGPPGLARANDTNAPGAAHSSRRRRGTRRLRTRRRQVFLQRRQFGCCCAPPAPNR